MIDYAYESFVNNIIYDIAEEKAYGYFTLIADFHKKVKELIKEDGSYNELCAKFQSDFSNAKTNKDAIVVCRLHLEDLQKIMDITNRLANLKDYSKFTKGAAIVELVALCFTFLGTVPVTGAITLQSIDIGKLQTAAYNINKRKTMIQELITIIRSKGKNSGLVEDYLFEIKNIHIDDAITYGTGGRIQNNIISR